MSNTHIRNLINDLTKTIEAPQEPRNESTIERCAREVGVHPNHLLNFIRYARWSTERFEANAQQPDWWKRLKHAARQREIDRLCRDVGPAGFARLTDQQILAKLPPKLKRWADTYRGRSAVLIGPTGCGKSLAAYLVLRRFKRAAADRELSPRWEPQGYGEQWSADESHFKDGWISAADLELATKCHKLGEPEPKDVIKTKTHRPMVIIDDITWPQKDDATRMVLGARYDRGLATIATAGLPWKALQARFKDAASRRLLDACGEQGDVVDCYGAQK